jgi:predicted nucleotidyltransferase
MARTDHQDVINALRTQGSTEMLAAADLLEIHDATGLNLHQAPNLLQFVREYAAMAVGEDTEIEDNHA